MIVVAGKQPGTRVYGIPGYIVVEIDGQSTQYSIAEILRAADIPVGLTYRQVQAITPLANMVADLTKKLIAIGTLDPEFTGEDGYDLAAIVETIEDIGGNYGEPDLNVS